MIETWRSGLFWMSVSYLAGMLLALILFRNLDQLKQLKAETPDQQQRIEKAIQSRDPAQLATAEREYQLYQDRLTRATNLAAGLGLVIMVTAILFMWSIWQVTACPVYDSESYARMAILCLPVLLILRIWTIESVLTLLFQKILSLVISFGQQKALGKIALHTGEVQIDRQIQSAFRFFYSILIITAIGAVTINGVIPPEVSLRALMPAIYLALALFALRLTYLIRQLRIHLAAESH